MVMKGVENGHGSCQYIHKVTLGPDQTLQYTMEDGKVIPDVPMMVIKTLLGCYIDLLESGKSMDEICELDFGMGPISLEQAKSFMQQVISSSAGSEAQGEPLDFTVSDPRALVIVQKMFVKDDFAKKCEPVQKHAFLYTGKEPKVGQRVQIQLDLPNGRWGRLSGEVTSVAPPPSDEEMLTGYWGEHSKEECNHPECFLADKADREPTRLRAKMVAEFGAVHGQRVVCRVALNFDFHHHTELVAFCEGADKQWNIELQCDDNLQCVWAGRSFTPAE